MNRKRDSSRLMTKEEGLAAEELNFRTRLFFLLVPIGVSLLLLGLVVLVYDRRAAFGLAGLSAGIFFLLGKFVVFAGIGNGVVELMGTWGWDFKIHLGPYQLASLVVYLDMTVAFIVAYNLDLLYRIPLLGTKLREVRSNSREILKTHRWIRKVGMLGVILFVSFPLTGTGAIGGTFLGQLLGMTRRRTLILIGFGSVLGSYGLAWGAYALGQGLAHFWQNPLVVILSALFLVAFLYVLSRLIRRAPVAGRQEQG